MTKQDGPLPYGVQELIPRERVGKRWLVVLGPRQLVRQIDPPEAYERLVISSQPCVVDSTEAFTHGHEWRPEGKVTGLDE